MNNLLKLISRGENESVEFKESLRLKEEIGQAVSAFSNAYKRVGKTNQRISSSELRKLAIDPDISVREALERSNLNLESYILRFQIEHCAKIWRTLLKQE